MLSEFYKILMQRVSGFGSNYILFICTALSFLGLLLYWKQLKKALLILTCFLSYPYSVILKSFFKFSRPTEAPPLITRPGFPADKYAFPSSHTVVYTVFLGYILYLTYKVENFKLSRFTPIVRVVCLLFLTLIGPSRVNLGYHSVRDVLAGYLFGGLFLGFIIFLDSPKLNSKENEKMLDKDQAKNS